MKQPIGIIALVFFLTSCAAGIVFAKTGESVAYYTCGMHPSVRIMPAEYKEGKTSCPICNMKLIPVYTSDVAEEEEYYGCGMEGAEHVFQIRSIRKDMTCPICGMPLKKLSKEEADKLKGVISRVRVEGRQAKLAGVKTDPVRRLRLFKEIRTIGKVAYDPELAIAQEEFISAMNTLDKVKEGNIADIERRTATLVESSRRKLRLLGLSEEQINELATTRKVQKNLLLPQKKMWIYGDVYEYELSWVRKGEKVKVMLSSLPGEELTGVISSVNPVLDPETRSVRFRAEIANPDLKLKPEMYVDIVIMSTYRGPKGTSTVLAIPKDAVLDTGVRKIVWVDKGKGEYEGRAVEVGPEAGAVLNGETKKFYPVLKGLSEGESVVTRANFLIDSQSQISGTAASAYSGALDTDRDKKTPQMHQH